MEAKANLLQESSSGSTAMWEAAGHNQISMITCIVRHDSEYTESGTRDAGSCAFLVEHANQVMEWLSHMHGWTGLRRANMSLIARVLVWRGLRVLKTGAC